MAKATLFEGKKIGKLTLLEKVDTYNWKCKCECGNTVVKKAQSLRTSAIRESKYTSCGCYYHGESKADTRLHRTWCSMKRRCNNPNAAYYELYGGRGIKVCDEWQTYLDFKKWALENGYTDELTLDRIDCNGNYEPTNCRWVTWKVQQNNRRNNKFLENKSFAEISKETGIKIKTLYERNRRGKEITKPLYEPLSIILNGEKITLVQIAKDYNIPIKTIYKRHKLGYSPENIVKPVKKTYNKSKI